MGSASFSYIMIVSVQHRAQWCCLSSCSLPKEKIKLTLGILLIFSFSSSSSVSDVRHCWAKCVLSMSSVCPVDDLMGCQDVLPLRVPHCAEGTGDVLPGRQEQIIPKGFQKSRDRNDNFAGHIFSCLKLTGLKKIFCDFGRTHSKGNST